MSYTNPLHPPVDASHYSKFSALGSAMSGPPAKSQFLSPFRRRLPQGIYTPGSKWKVAMGRSNQLNNSIPFDYIGYSKQGVPMRELSSRGAHALAMMIQGANDPVFSHTGLQRITFRILWPGYGHIEWARSVEVNTQGQGHVTRAQLGAAIAMNFARFLEKARYDASTCTDYHIGPSGITFEHLILLSLNNVFDDVWQADVAIDLR